MCTILCTILCTSFGVYFHRSDLRVLFWQIFSNIAPFDLGVNDMLNSELEKNAVLKRFRKEKEELIVHGKET